MSNREEYLFLPEAKMVDKLLGVFNLQSQQKMDTNEVISILGLLNLLNIVSISQEGKGNHGLSDLNSLNNNGLNQILNSLQGDSGKNNVLNNLGNLLGQNSGGDNVLNSLLGALGNSTTSNTNSSSNGLDPSLMLKLMGLLTQMKGSKNKEKVSKDEENDPVPSKNYEEDEILD